MAARAIWRGQIRLALVSIPVELFPATKSGAAIQFHQVHEPSGKRIKYEKVVPGIGPVDRDEIVKGYEVSKGHYVLLDPEEIDSVKLESRKTLDLVQFVESSKAARRSTSSSSSTRTRSTRPILRSPTMLSRPTTSPKKLTSSFAMPSRPRKRSASASLRCAGRNMSSL